MSRAGKIVISALLVLIAAVAAAVFSLFNSQLALRLLVARLAPAGLSVKKISGSLAGPLRLEGITYRGEKGTRIKIAALGIDWRPTELFNLDLHITRLAVTKLQITTEIGKAGPRPPKPLPKLHLPAFFSITLDKAVARDIEYLPPPPKKPMALSGLTLGAHMRGDTLFITRMEATAPRYSVSLRGKIKTMDYYPMTLKIKWGFTPEGYPRAEGFGSLEGTLEKMHVLQTISPPYNAGADFIVANLLPQASLQASLPPGPKPGPKLNPKLEWKGKIRWRSLRVAPTGKKAVNSPRGELTTEGNAGAYRFGVDAEISLMKKAPASRIMAKGAGDMTSLKLESFRAALLGGELHGSGSLRLKKPAPGFEFKFKLAGKGLNPAWVSTKWNGDINLEAAIAGRIGRGMRNISLDISTLNGRLRGYPLGGSGRIRIRDHDYFIPGINIRSGSAVIAAAGSFLRGRWDLSWKLRAKNLAELLPDAGGSLSATGILTGGGSPVVKATITGSGARYKNYKVKLLSSDIRVDLSDRTDSNIGLIAAGLEFPSGNRRIQEIRVKAAGRLVRHRVTVSIKGAAKGLKTALALSAKGGYSHGLWNGSISRLDVSGQLYGDWGLQHPAPLRFSKGMASADICLSRRGGAAMICLKADLQRPKGLHLQLAASRVPLGLFHPLLPPGLLVTGTLDGSADILYSHIGLYSQIGALTGSADIRLADGAIVYALEGRKARLTFRQGIMRLQGTTQTVTFTWDMPFVEGGGIKSRVTVFRQKTPTVKGSIQMNVPNIGILPAALPSVRDVRGVLTATLDVSGPIRSPDVKGKLTIEKASAALPRLGIRLTGVSLAATGAGKDKFHIEGVLHSGAGFIAIKGDLTRAPAGPENWQAALGIKGENFQALKIPEAQAMVGPDLKVSLANKVVRVGGTVEIPQASIKIRELSGAVKPSLDVVIAGEKRAAARAVQFKIYADIKAILGKKITFAGFGLTSGIAGSLALHEEPGRIATGQGELVITKGKYKAYGQALDIEHGRLFFAGGPVNNPGLDIRAARKAENNVVAGIYVSGTLQSPKLSIFSEPPMDQTDALSYLVLGKPLHSASGSDGNLLYSAATTAGLAGGEFLAKRIGTLFGITKVSVEKGPPQKTTGQQQATLFLGRYLSPRLYVAYGIGLFETSNVFRVRYRITRDWMVQTETGTATGGDVLYKLEWQ